MQNSRHHNTLRLLSIEDDMPATFQAAQTGPNIIACAASRGIFSEHPATRLQIIKVTDGLILTPVFERITSDTQQVALSAARKPELSHALSRRLGKAERSPDTRKRIPFANAAGIAFVDCRPQRS